MVDGLVRAIADTCIVHIYVNGGIVKGIYDSDSDRWHEMNGILSVELDAGDVVSLYNLNKDVIRADTYYPFTFMGILMS